MKEEKIQVVVSNFEDKFRVWLSSQEGQTSAYDYEKSYVEFMQTVSSETLSETVGSEGKSRNSKKKIQTSLGKIEVMKGHLLSETKGFFKISPYFQTKLCYVGQKEVFVEGSADIEEFLGLKISAKQIENVSHYWGEEIGKLMTSENFEKTERSMGLHYVMMDGAMILSSAENRAGKR